MTCKNGHFMDDKLLVCRRCAEEQSEPAMHELQREFLRKVADGEYHYGLRVAKGPQRHVIMYSSHTRTFCGTELKTPQTIHYEEYNGETLAGVCPGCRRAILSVIEELAP